MNARVTIDKAGRIVLPKAIREELHLCSGETLDLTAEGEQLTLRPRRATPPLQKEHGVWVFRTGEPLTAHQTRNALEAARAQRARRDLGESR